MLVVDTCILIDIADDDPEFAERSVECVASRLDEGLVISPASYVELAPVFDGERRSGRVPRRPVADALIGATAMRHNGVITRNGGDFLALYPKIRTSTRHETRNADSPSCPA